MGKSCGTKTLGLGATRRGGRALLRTLALPLTLALAGCQMQAHVAEVHGHPATLATGESASIEQTRTAILRAANERGYVVESDDGRTIYARVSSGPIWALMRIDYAAGLYSITHAGSSPELNYDYERGTVHRRYNRWLDRLHASIERELSRPSAAPPPPEMVTTLPPLQGSARPAAVAVMPPVAPSAEPAPAPTVGAAPVAAPSPGPTTIAAAPSDARSATPSGWISGAPAEAAPPPAAPAPARGALDI